MIRCQKVNCTINAWGDCLDLSDHKPKIYTQEDMDMAIYGQHMKTKQMCIASLERVDLGNFTRYKMNEVQDAIERVEFE